MSKRRVQRLLGKVQEGFRKTPPADGDETPAPSAKKLPWASDLAGGVESVPPTDEERILMTLGDYVEWEEAPMPFSKLRLRSMIFNDERFWEILQSLCADGKVVRVADATETTDSLWNLPLDDVREEVNREQDVRCDEEGCA